jgi:predicted alpha/beta superfamily hydrolase
MMIRKIGILSMIFIISTAFFPVRGAILEPGPASDVVIGKSMTLKSKILNMPVKLKISVPVGYEKSTAKYPVLFLFNDHFHLTTGLLHLLVRHGMVPGMLVVDFTNCPSGYFTPTALKGRPGTGGADTLIGFMRDELIPFIDSHYRTQPYRITAASSWGGLFAVYAMLTAPEVFNAAIASGPWLVYDNLDLIAVKNNKAILKKGTYEDNFYMLKHGEGFLREHSYSGNLLFFSAGDQPELAPSIDFFARILKRHAPKELEWIYDPMPLEDHGSLIANTFFDGLKKLYEKWRDVPEDVVLGGKEAIADYEKMLAGTFGYDIGIAKYALRTYGWTYYDEGSFKKSIRAFQLNMDMNPGADAHFCLGRAYGGAGELEAARKHYQKACNLAKTLSSSILKRYEGLLKNVNEKIAAQQ